MESKTVSDSSMQIYHNRDTTGVVSGDSRMKAIAVGFVISSGTQPTDSVALSFSVHRRWRVGGPA